MPGWTSIKRRLRAAAAPLLPARAAPVLSARDRQQEFEDVYARNLWGEGEQGAAFYSGPGSRGDPAQTYVEHMVAQLRGHEVELGRPLTIVDIGCGDFAVGRALTEALPTARYIGCDIVAGLVAHHSEHHASDRVSFRHLDIVTERPPEGDVCLVRQVFQHLSNGEIAAGLENVRAFPFLYVTEGRPTKEIGPFNPDKRAGGDVRFGYDGVGRGVELAEAPYNRRVEEICRAAWPPHEVVVTERIYPVEETARSAV